MSTDQDDGSIFVAPVTPPQVTAPDPDAVKTSAPQPNLDEVFGEHLAKIKNEAGEQKYGDVVTALSALSHTQQHVKTLEEENERFRQEDVKAKTMDEVLQQIEATKQTSVAPTSNTELDVEKMRNVTFDTIKEYEAQQTAAKNQTSVVSALVEKFQDQAKAEEAFNRKAEELGLSVQILNELSATSPKAVLEYFQISKESSPKPTEGSVNTDALGTLVKPTEPKKNIMYGASTSDIIAAWRSAAPSVD